MKVLKFQHVISFAPKLFFSTHAMSYWEEYHHQREFRRCLNLIKAAKQELTNSLLPGIGKSRRSSVANTSFGIRASALDFPREGMCDGIEDDLIVRLKKKYETYEEYESDWKRKIERIKERKKKKEIAKEKERKDKEEKEKEIEEEKERKQKEEQEKESKENLFSNDLSSSFIEFSLQEPEEEFPKETSSFESPCLKRKTIAIIPSAPLNTQPSFGSQTHERNEGKHMESFDLSKNNHDACFVKCLVEEANENLNHNRAGLYLIEKQNFYVHFERIKFDFLKLVFDPGG